MRRIKRRIKRFARNLYSISEDRIISMASNYDVISFDIFDTLVVRDIGAPEEIFQIVEKTYKERHGRDVGFLSARVEAEKRARKKNIGEVSLGDIYSEMMFIDKETREELKQIEEEVETEYCCTNLKIKKIYESLRQSKATIIIVSDMYLSERRVKAILDKCGYSGYDRLFLSSKYKKTKRSGELFEEVRRIYTGLILHIGDDIITDYLAARQHGIKGVLIDENRKLSFWIRERSNGEVDEIPYFIKNHKPIGPRENLFFVDVGYEVLGPMLLGYSEWLYHQLSINEIDTVLFLSREGRLLFDAFEIVHSEEWPTKKYIFVSRRALTLSLLHECDTYEDFLDTISPAMKTHTLANVGKLCGFDDEWFKIQIESMGLFVEDNMFSIPAPDKAGVLQIVKDGGRDKFREQADYFYSYLQQEGVHGRIALIDVGWNGTMQKMMDITLRKKGGDVSLFGFYLGVRDGFGEDYYKGLRREGYLFEPDRDSENDLKIRFTTEILEQGLFLNTDGSVREYKKVNGKIEPVFECSEYNGNTSKWIRITQDSALLFLKEIKALSRKPCIDWELFRQAIMDSYTRFAVYPSNETVSRYRDFITNDIEMKPFYPAHTIVFYLLHPKRFRLDIEGNVCKIFFLQYLFKVRLPYYDFLKIINNRLKYKSEYRKNIATLRKLNGRKEHI